MHAIAFLRLLLHNIKIRSEDMDARFVEGMHYHCDARQKRCTLLRPKEIPYYDLTFVLKGKMTYLANGRELVLEKGDAILLRPGTLRARLAGEEPVHFVSFNFYVREGAILSHAELMKAVLTPAIPKLVTALPQRRISATDSRADGKAVALLEYILLELLDAQERKSDNAHVVAVLDYVCAHIGEHIMLRDVAAQVNLSKEYICALFKREMGCTLTEYVNTYRLALARERIEAGESALAEIAASLGFENYHYFSRSFKKKYGVPPLSCRKQIELGE